MPPADPTPIRQGVEPPGVKIKRLQEEIDATMAAETMHMRSVAFGLVEACDGVQDWPMSAGEREEWRQMGEGLKIALKRMTALGARR